MASEIGIAFIFLIQTGLALLTVLGACFCIASHFFFQPAPASQHSTFRDANWPPRCVQLHTRAEHTRPASSHSRNRLMHVADGGKTDPNTNTRCTAEKGFLRKAAASSAGPQKTDRKRTVSRNFDDEERSSVSTAVPTDTRKHPIQGSIDHQAGFWLPLSELENTKSTIALDEWRLAGVPLGYSAGGPQQTTDQQVHQQGSQANPMNPLPLPPPTWQPLDATPQQFKFSSLPPCFSGASNERDFLNERNHQLDRTREADLLGAFEGYSVDLQNHTHEYDAACRAAVHGRQNPTAACARSVGWNRARPAAPNMTHAKATLDHVALPNALKMNQDSLQLYSTSSTRVQAESSRTNGYQTQEIAELCRMANAIESLLSSSTKRTSKEDSPKEQPVPGATADLPDDSASSRRAANAESDPLLPIVKPLAEPALNTKPQDEPEEGSCVTPHPPAKRDASAVDQDCGLHERNGQNHRMGCRHSCELVKKPRVGVMTNVLLLICRYATHTLVEEGHALGFISHQNKDYKAGRVRLHDWCRRNAGSLSPDQCASATANYFSAKKGGSTADFEVALDAVKQLRPIFCPSVASFFEFNILEDLMCESDLALFSTAVWLTSLFAAADSDLHETRLSRAVASLKVDAQLLLKAAICFSSTTLKPEFSEQEFSRVLAQLSNAVLRRSSRIRLTKTENPEKEIGKGGQGQVEYGSSWQPLLNELRASCEHQKTQSETRVPPKRRSFHANAETDEACRTQQSEGTPAQEAMHEACKHEEGLSTAFRRASKGPTTGQQQPEGHPSATFSTPHEASQAKQHDLRKTHCVQQTASRVKPEASREPRDDGQGNEERTKRQRRTSDSTSTTESSRHSMQAESEAHLPSADVQGSTVTAAASHLTSQDAELGPQQTAKKTSPATPAKPPPHSCLQGSLASRQTQQGASSNTAQQNSLRTPQQNRAKRIGGGNSQPAAQDQARRYNTRSRGVIKNER